MEGARQLGFELTARGNQDLSLKFLGVEAKFQVLNVMEFSSERGRMSVIVRSPDGSIRLLVKGSDAKMLALMRPDTPKIHIEETNKNLHLFATQVRLVVSVHLLGFQSQIYCLCRASEKEYGSHKWATPHQRS